jgi:hypothetical protein
VEYIWSWARDVYRPAIKTLIEKSMNEYRGLSPASTGQFRRSLSLSSLTSLQPSSQDKGPMEPDQTNYRLDRSISNELRNEGKGVEDTKAVGTHISCSASTILWICNLSSIRHGITGLWSRVSNETSPAKRAVFPDLLDDICTNQTGHVSVALQTNPISRSKRRNYPTSKLRLPYILRSVCYTHK